MFMLMLKDLPISLLCANILGLVTFVLVGGSGAIESRNLRRRCSDRCSRCRLLEEGGTVTRLTTALSSRDRRSKCIRGMGVSRSAPSRASSSERRNFDGITNVRLRVRRSGLSSVPSRLVGKRRRLSLRSLVRRLRTAAEAVSSGGRPWAREGDFRVRGRCFGALLFMGLVQVWRFYGKRIARIKGCSVVGMSVM